MFLKSALSSFELTRLDTTPSLSDSLLINKANLICKLFVEEVADIPKRSTLEQIYKRVKEAFNSRGKIKLSSYDLHYSPWVIFEPFENDKPLMGHWRFWRFYSKLTSGTYNYRYFKAMYASYITSYPYQEKYITTIQSHIKKMINEGESLSLQRLKPVFGLRLTLEADAHLSLLNDTKRTGDIEKTLRDNGLLDGFESAKLTQLVFKNYLVNLPNNPAPNINSQLIN